MGKIQSKSFDSIIRDIKTEPTILRQPIKPTLRHKFGGSSLATAEKIKTVSNIINCKDEAVVVSAS
ncbi:hypothetical protein, partial [Francisella tularensis]|uniref:hypothetical protein n=1 Tax=Francisella tularensis TaxID=263 RepID=UPI003C6CD043